MRFKLLYVRPHLWFYKRNEDISEHAGGGGGGHGQVTITGAADAASSCDDDGQQQQQHSAGIQNCHDVRLSSRTSHDDHHNSGLNPPPSNHFHHNLRPPPQLMQALSTRAVRRGKEVRQCTVVDAGCTCRATVSSNNTSSLSSSSSSSNSLQRRKALRQPPCKLRTAAGTALPCSPHSAAAGSSRQRYEPHHVKWHQKLSVAKRVVMPQPATCKRSRSGSPPPTTTTTTAAAAATPALMNNSMFSRLVCKSAADAVDIANSNNTLFEDKDRLMVSHHHRLSLGESHGSSATAKTKEEDGMARDKRSVEEAKQMTVNAENPEISRATGSSCTSELASTSLPGRCSSSSSSSGNSSGVHIRDLDSNTENIVSDQMRWTSADMDCKLKVSCSPAATATPTPTTMVMAPSSSSSSSRQQHESVISLAELRDSIKQMKMNAKTSQLPPHHRVYVCSTDHAIDNKAHLRVAQDDPLLLECVSGAGAEINNKLDAILESGDVSTRVFQHSPVANATVNCPDKEMMDKDSADGIGVTIQDSRGKDIGVIIQSSGSRFYEIEDELEYEEVVKMQHATTISCEIQVLSDYDGYDDEGGESASPPTSSSSSSESSSLMTSPGPPLYEKLNHGNLRHSCKTRNPCGKDTMKKNGNSGDCSGGGAVAIVKSSYDPHQDFKESMVEMVIVKRLRGRGQLQQLLQCYLSLNPEEYHPTIVKVFHELCSELFHAHCEQ